MTKEYISLDMSIIKLVISYSFSSTFRHAFIADKSSHHHSPSETPAPVCEVPLISVAVGKSSWCPEMI